MAELIRGLEAGRVRANLDEVREDIAAACARSGRDPGDIEILAAVKYVAVEELGVLLEAGITLAGENRAQELERKAEAVPGFTWDFIGHLQSRKVKQILPHVRLVHSVATDSVLRELGKHGDRPAVLVEVNLSGEEDKSGIAPGELDDFLARAVEVATVEGLMTMPPLADDPEDSRRWFAALAELAAARGLSRLSMGTTQDFAVAVEEGATIIRIGTRLYR